MKFGKRYLETLAQPGIPQEWRQTAIEYRKLKKVINRVASELADLGLTSDVLKDLLENQPDAQPGGKLEELRADTTEASSSSRQAGPSGTSGVHGVAMSADGNVKLVDTTAGAEASGVKEPPRLRWDSSDEDENEGSRGKRKARKGSRRRATAAYELGGTSANPEPRIRLIFESASSVTESSSGHSDFFQRESSDTEPSGVGSGAGRFAEVDSSEEDTKAADGEDVVGAGEEDESESASASAHTPAGDFEGAGPRENTLLKRLYGIEGHSDDEQGFGAEDEEPPRRNSDETVRWEDLNPEQKREVVHEAELEAKAAAASKAKKEAGSAEADAGDAFGDEADDEGASSAKPRVRRHRHRRHRKEVFIPLNSDSEFLTLLAQALSSLAALQLAQKQQFVQAVELLSRQVSKVSSPSRPKSDLYVWREIFALWVESQIFESERERDRGERTVEDAETKLDWFVDQVAVRKLAKKMRNKESRESLEKFIKLNVQLLDLKRFQLANEEAARKILKKHDKRTALTASLGFPQFISAASALSTTSSSDPKKRILVLPGFPSLPHVLLSTLTSTLLPIIPQLDDYECGICGDVAFKPIKLDCGHRFCVRCLVKMQKRGQDACPSCRSPVVLRANAANLDHVMQDYLELWFPKEVKVKEKSNRSEAAKEELDAMGLSDSKCTIC